VKHLFLIVLALPCLLHAAEQDLLLRTKHKEVEVSLLIPKESRPVQGLLVHVFNYKMKVHDRSATLCRELKWAHVNTIISRKTNNRPKKIREALNVALERFANETGLKELVYVPRTGTGFSAGGMCIPVLEVEHDKMLTNAISCSWVRDTQKMTPEAAAIPEQFIIGSIPDGFNMLPAIEKHFEPAIEKGYPWSLGLQHGCKHDWANSGTLMVPWIKSIAKLRYPEKIDVSKPIPLKTLSMKEGWYGNRTTINGTYASVFPIQKNTKPDPKKFTWFPDRKNAYVWRAWQTKNSPVDLTAETLDGEDKLSPFNPKKSFGLYVKPDSKLKLGINPKKEMAIQKVTFYIGDEVIAALSKAPFTTTWQGPKIGTRPIWAQYEVDGKPAVTNPALICFEPDGEAMEKVIE
jgi:hypothetical protein